MTHSDVTEFANHISCIDTRYQRPGLAACYLLQCGGEAAFIDTGTAPAASTLMQVLATKGIARERVRYVIPTHVHLDHAGGAGQLMQLLPEARLVVHPLGARHLVDPAKLIAGAIAVYGEEKFNSLYGELIPVPADRVAEAQDGLVLWLGERRLRCLDTPGHARHHLCLFDEQSRSLFTGDAFGLSYREFDSAKGPFILPTTTPVQFDPEAWHHSLDRLMALQPERVYVTHFGRLVNPQRLVSALRQGIDDHVSIALQAPQAQRGPHLRAALFDWVRQKLALHGCAHTPDQIEHLLGMDLDLNAQGLEVWLDRRARASNPQ